MNFDLFVDKISLVSLDSSCEEELNNFLDLVVIVVIVVVIIKLPCKLV